MPRIRAILWLAFVSSTSALHAAKTSGPPIVFDPSFGRGGNLSGTNIKIDPSRGQLDHQTLIQNFSRFNIRPGSTVEFEVPDNGAPVQRIVANVRGGSATRIQGTLTVDGPTTSFFLLNPLGIIFSAGAKINVPGDFVVTTADQVQISPGRESTAAGPQPVLSIADVASFGFKRPAPAGIYLRGDTSLALVSGRPHAIALVGGSVQMNHATLSAPSGAVQILSTSATGTIRIGGNSPVEPVLSRGGVVSLDHSQVDVSGVRGGKISVTGGQLNLELRSALRAGTTGNQNGAGIDLNLAGRFNLYISQIDTTTTGNGNAGNVNIRAGDIDMLGGDTSEPVTPGSRNVIGTPNGIITISGMQPTNTFSQTRLGRTNVRSAQAQLPAVDTNLFGNAGNINLQAANLSMRNDAEMDTTTFTHGHGGDIDLNIAGTVQLIDTEELHRMGPFFGGDLDTSLTQTQEQQRGSSLLARTAGTFSGAGAGGNINVQCSSLILGYGGLLTVTSRGAGNAGNIAVTADSISISNALPPGVSGNALNAFTGISSKTEFFDPNHPNTPNGNGGNILINAGKINISEDVTSTQIIGSMDPSALITTSTQDSSTAGSIVVDARDISLKGLNSNITVNGNISQADANAGNLYIRVDRSLQLEDQAEIAGVARGGSGGDVTVIANGNVTIDNASISAEAAGNGGDVLLIVPRVLTLDDGTINANADLSGGQLPGNAGNISILGLSSERQFETRHGVISAQAANLGKVGGKIKIVGFGKPLQLSSDLTNIQRSGATIGTTKVTAAANRGVPGEVDIDSTVPNFAALLAPLFAPLQSAEARLQDCCQLKLTRNLSSFVQKGTGSTPLEPGGWTPVLENNPKSTTQPSVHP